MKKSGLLFVLTIYTSLILSQTFKCGQHNYLNELLKDPHYKEQYEIDKKIQDKVYLEMINNPKIKRGTIYKIPVVFHVLHSNGIENISREQILNQLAILNRDFRLKNIDANNVHPDFKGMPSDVEIEFVLATKAPNGNFFLGITRTYTPSPITSGSSQVSYIRNNNDVYKGEWAGNKYLNFFISSGLGGPAGYTFKPNQFGNLMSSGIYIRHDFVGSIGTSNEVKSRALTHEVGHWLNLDHTWGGTNEPGEASNCNTDDGIEDTPNCIGDTVCNLNSNACGPRANIENYMEYSYCSKMFTKGQTERMRAALISTVGGRNYISSSKNLAEVGGSIIADFSSLNKHTCEGGVIQFSDMSLNNPKTWIWSFPGGSPSSSTEQNPLITYSSKGKYSVSLTISDGNDTKKIDKIDYINVAEKRKDIPFLETFSSNSNISSSNNWVIENFENNQSFEIIEGVGYSDNKCIKLNNYKESGYNKDELISNCINLSNTKDQAKLTLTFRYAYRKKNTSNSEVLRVIMSSDCGLTWQTRKTITGNSLSPYIETNDWTPKIKSDWTTVHITNITENYWNNNARVKFTFDGSGGNNFYLDDINFYPFSPSTDFVLDLKKQNSLNYLSLYPNPTEKEINIEFSINQQQDLHYEIIDVIGNRVEENKIYAENGNNIIIIPTSELIPGSYFLKLNFTDKPVIKYFQVGK